MHLLVCQPPEFFFLTCDLWCWRKQSPPLNAARFVLIYSPASLPDFLNRSKVSTWKPKRCSEIFWNWNRPIECHSFTPLSNSFFYLGNFFYLKSANLLISHLYSVSSWIQSISWSDSKPPKDPCASSLTSFELPPSELHMYSWAAKSTFSSSDRVNHPRPLENYA